MRYGSLLRQMFKIRWKIKNTQDHHVIPRQFKNHTIVKRIGYDINAYQNIIILPREIGNLRKNRVIHDGPHYKYNKFVGTVLDSMVYMENPEPEFKEFVNFLKIGCRFRPQDIPWN